jgi:hypothetical protein
VNGCQYRTGVSPLVDLVGGSAVFYDTKVKVEKV